MTWIHSSGRALVLVLAMALLAVGCETTETATEGEAPSAQSGDVGLEEKARQEAVAEIADGRRQAASLQPYRERNGWTIYQLALAKFYAVSQEPVKLPVVSPRPQMTELVCVRVIQDADSVAFVGFQLVQANGAWAMGEKLVVRDE